MTDSVEVLPIFGVLQHGKESKDNYQVADTSG